jgi:hypothetical protein
MTARSVAQAPCRRFARALPMIDAYAHIVPPRYLERVERLLEHWQPSERVKLYRSWLR